MNALLKLAPKTARRIDDNGVRVGFKTGSEAGGFKTGAWTPVYVDLTAGPERVGRADGQIIVETTDSDELANAYAVDLPPMEPQEQATVVTYARPGTTGSDIVVSIRGPDGRLMGQQKAGKSGYDAPHKSESIHVAEVNVGNQRCYTASPGLRQIRERDRDPLDPYPTGIQDSVQAGEHSEV